MVLAFGFISCTREPDRTVTHRGREGRPDQWVYPIDKDSYKIAIDTNGDGRPDVVKTYKNSQVVQIESDQIESDRNFDGQTDLVQVYAHWDLIREIHDDTSMASPRKSKNSGTASW
jgi:hypothetical protein